MTRKEREILKLEENFKDIVEKDVAERQESNTEIIIKDIKMVGQINYNDKINSQKLTGNVFIVEKQIAEIDKFGGKRITEQKTYYLNDKCIGGDLGNGEIVYKQSFLMSEPEKLNSIKDLIEKTPEEEIEKTSMNKLQTKEVAEVLSVAWSRKVTEKEAQKILNHMDESEKEEIKNSNDKEKTIKKLKESGIISEKGKKNEKEQETELSKKQADKIKVNGIEKVNLNEKIDGIETLGQRLDLEEYDDMYVVYSTNVDDINPGKKRNDTMYSLVGIKKDGTAKVLNDEFEMDKSYGNNGTQKSTKIRADSTATRDNKDVSVYTRKSNGMSIGCENDMGEVNLFIYQKTYEKNENVGIQIETSKTGRIPVETRRVMNRNKGIYQKDQVQKEIEEHTNAEDNPHNPENVQDFDGNENTETHIHDDELEKYVQEIFNYKDDDGNEHIKEIFTEKEVREKLQRELEKNAGNLSKEQAVENVKEEMNEDAKNLDRTQNREGRK